VVLTLQVILKTSLMWSMTRETKKKLSFYIKRLSKIWRHLKHLRWKYWAELPDGVGFSASGTVAGSRSNEQLGVGTGNNGNITRARKIKVRLNSCQHVLNIDSHWISSSPPSSFTDTFTGSYGMLGLTVLWDITPPATRHAATVGISPIHDNIV